MRSTAARQADLRRLMKAEKERRRKLKSESPKNGTAAQKKPKGILRAPKHGGTAEPAGESARALPLPHERREVGVGLGGLLDDYGSDSDSDGGESGEDRALNGNGSGEVEIGVAAVAVGLARPTVVFAPDVKLQPSVATVAVPGRPLFNSHASKSTVEGSPVGPEMDVETGGAMDCSGHARGGSDGEGDGVDPDAWKEFEEFVGDEEDVAHEGSGSAQTEKIEVAEEKAVEEKESLAPAAEKGRHDNKTIDKSETPSKQRKKKNEVSVAVDNFTEAVEQAAYEARLARLMLLRSCPSKKRLRNGLGVDAARQDGREEETGAAYYAPALAFQDDDMKLRDKMRPRKDNYKGEEVNEGDEGLPATVRKERETTDSGSATEHEGGKRKPSSTLAVRILRKNRARAKKIAHAEEVDGDLGW